MRRDAAGLGRLGALRMVWHVLLGHGRPGEVSFGKLGFVKAKFGEV